MRFIFKTDYNQDIKLAKHGGHVFWYSLLGLGLGLLGAAVIGFRDMPLVGVILIGVGNAAFHVGAGAIVAMASDMRVATDRAKCAFLFTRVGLAGAIRTG